MNTVLNFEDIDPRQQPLFLGKDLGLQRYDRLKYPALYKLAEAQEQFFWRANEVSLLKDRSDYKELSDNERFIFDSNLKWQTATDSLLSRSLLKLGEYVSNPELEACINVWAFFESNIHSRSYSHILKNIYPNETVFWNSILEDKEIKNRMVSIKKSYDKLFNDDEKDLKSKIFNSLVATNITEGLSFYVSFACSFYFGVNGKMEGNSKIIRLIERDEAAHCAVTTFILKTLRKEASEGFLDTYSDDKIYEAYSIALETEKEWSNYLFQHGSLLGLSSEQFKAFAEFKHDQRLKSLGLKTSFNHKVNPLGSWYDQFTDREAVQVAPQETEITSYKIGARNSEIVDSELSDIEL